jgi:hypothetical protein
MLALLVLVAALEFGAMVPTKMAVQRDGQQVNVVDFYHKDTPRFGIERTSSVAFTSAESEVAGHLWKISLTFNADKPIILPWYTVLDTERNALSSLVVHFSVNANEIV